MNATVHLHLDAEAPRADALYIAPGRHFIVLHVGGMDLMLPTGDDVTIAAARAISAALTACADDLDRTLAFVAGAKAEAQITAGAL